MFRICCECKRIYGCKPADDAGNYDYTQYTHGFCEKCVKERMKTVRGETTCATC